MKMNICLPTANDEALIWLKRRWNGDLLIDMLYNSDIISKCATKVSRNLQKVLKMIKTSGVKCLHIIRRMLNKNFPYMLKDVSLDISASHAITSTGDSFLKFLILSYYLINFLLTLHSLVSHLDSFLWALLVACTRTVVAYVLQIQPCLLRNRRTHNSHHFHL